MKRRRALQLGMATVLGGLAASRAEAAETAAEDVQEFGPAMLSVAIAGFTAYGTAAYLSTRNRYRPSRSLTISALGSRLTASPIRRRSPLARMR